MNPIYLDHAATTPMRPEVRDAMAPYWTEHFGNPGSTHRFGRRAQAAVEEARATVAEALGAHRREIVFVRGGTESDNLALLGRAGAVAATGGVPRVAVCATDHKAVLEAGHAVARLGGGTCTDLPVDAAGRLDPGALDAALADGPACVSVMWVNNETGVVQPIPEIAARCADAGVVLHTDAVQALGKVRVRLDEVPVGLLSITGHKIRGPKSTGALFVRDGVRLESRIFGGGQEGGLRPGTLDTAGIVGFATAVRLAALEQASHRARMLELRDGLLGRLRARIPDLRVLGEGAEAAGHVLNVGISGVSGELLMVSLDMEGLAVSGGSACASGSTGPSHVVSAMWGDDVPDATIRFSFGADTTEDEIERASEITSRVVARLRALPVGV